MQGSMRDEGKFLASTPYGARILQVLGRIYTLQSEVVLGGEPPSVSIPECQSLPYLMYGYGPCVLNLRLDICQSMQHLNVRLHFQ